MPELHVAVGVILDAENRVLLSKRAPGAHQGGLWEFPGGKVEAGEPLSLALKRELQEELGIDTGATIPLIEVRHNYGDKCVLLDVHVVREYRGEPRGLEQQPLEWVAIEDLESFEFPAANVPIVQAVLELLR